MRNPVPWARRCSTPTTAGTARAMSSRSSSASWRRRLIDVPSAAPRAERDGGFLEASGPQDSHRGLRPRAARAEEAEKISHPRDGLAVEAHEHVAEEKPRLGGRAPGLDAEDEEPGGLPQRRRDRVGEGDPLARDAEKAAFRPPGREDVADGPPQGGGRQSDGGASDEGRGVHAEEAPGEIDERASRETPGRRAVGLHVAIDAPSGVRRPGLADRAEDAEARADRPPGAREGEGEVAHPQGVGLGPDPGSGDRRAGLEDGEIDRLVPPRDLGGHGGPVGEADRDRAVMIERVIGRDDDSVREDGAREGSAAAPFDAHDGGAGGLDDRGDGFGKREVGRGHGGSPFAPESTRRSGAPTTAEGRDSGLSFGTGSPSDRDEAEPSRPHHRLGARAGAELAEDGVHVKFRRPLADEEARADLAAREAEGEELEHLDLAPREAPRLG